MYARVGNTTRIVSSKMLESGLRPGVHIANIDPYKQYYLTDGDDFTPLTKYYGNTEKNAARIFNTFQQRTQSTGVLLGGEKGSGKTLLSKRLSILAKEAGLPTIMVNKPFFGDDFNEFITNIQEHAVIIFDEFEKVYDKKEQQPQILTLLDGTITTKKLFIFTVNDMWEIDRHMINRPGRIFYKLDFKSLDDDFILEYAKDHNLIDDHAQELVRLKLLFGRMNFDMLQAIVEEMHRYNESPTDTIRYLNIDAADMEQTYIVHLAERENDPFIDYRRLSTTEWKGSIINFRNADNSNDEDEIDEYYDSGNKTRISITYAERLDENQQPSGWKNAHFETKIDLVNVDYHAKQFTFRNKFGNILVLTPRSYTPLNLSGMSL